MLEELKIIIEMLEGVAGLGIGVLVGFIVFKLITFLATTGTIVYLVKLITTYIYEYMITEKAKPQVTVKVKELSDEFISDVVMVEFLELIRSLKKSTVYVHESDVKRFKRAVKELEEREARGKGQTL